MAFCFVTVHSCFCQVFEKKLAGKWHMEDSTIIMNFYFVSSSNLQIELIIKADSYLKLMDTSGLNIDVSKIKNDTSPILKNRYAIDSVQGNTFRLKVIKISEEDSMSSFSSKCTFEKTDIFRMELVDEKIKRIITFHKVK